MSDEGRPAEQDGALEPFTNLLEAAFALHELFSTYISAGFTREEALYLVAAVLRPERPGV